MPTPSTAYGTPGMNFNGTPAPLNFRHKRADIVLQNGANNNIARNDANYLRITGPSAAFSISGFDTPLSGMMLYVQVAISQQLTIKNKSLSSVKNQIDTLTNADVTVTATPCVITFIYDSSTQKWVYGGIQAKSSANATGVGAKLTPVGWWNASGGVNASYPFSIQGDLLYTRMLNTFVGVGNVGDVTDIGFVVQGYSSTPQIGTCVVNGKYIYVLTSTPSLVILDASNIYAMTVVSTTAITGAAINRLELLHSSGAGLYAVIDNGSSLLVYNVTTPATPVLYDTITTSGYSYFKCNRFGIFISDPTASTFKIYSLGAPSTLRGTYTFTGGVVPGQLVVTATRQNRLANKDPESIAYIVDYNTSIVYVINCGDTTAPTLAGSFLSDSILGQYNAGTTAYTVEALAIGGGYFFTGGKWSDAGQQAGVVTQHSLVNPLAPQQVSRDVDLYYTNDYPAYMRVYGNHLFSKSGYSGVIFVHAYT